MINLRRTVFSILAVLITVSMAASTWGSGLGAGLRQGAGVRRAYHHETGMLSFLGADPAEPITVPSALVEGLTSGDRAMAILDAYGWEFGLEDPRSELRVMRTTAPAVDRASVRYQQVYQGVPVLAGELIVNTDSLGGLLSISGEISPDLSISTAPALTADEAEAIALQAIAKAYGMDEVGLEASDPQLWIFDERLLMPSARPTTLVWRMEISGNERIDIRELVLVNADLGGIALHFNQVDMALNRRVYDNENSTAYGLPGNGPVRSEGGPPTGISEVDLAYDYSGDTYNFYFNEHGRDSLDDAGMTLISTVRYCPSGGPCPYANAFWNGSQMVYGDGYASADDVVAHELTHGVTNYESHLFYFYQSGAISEAFSDIWGEFVDQTNGAGNDTSGVRWLMGEDLPAGASRDMSNPPAFSDPDQTDSVYYVCGSSDNGGLHSNSGVANKVAYLLTDGDSFNGYTVTGLGISRVADLFYEVNTNLLTSGSNFNDLYNTLIQASFNIGFSAAERQEVEDAIDATEMNRRPCGDPDEAPVCSGGLSPVDLFFDDLENTGSGNWTSAADVGVNEWYYPQNTHSYPFDATNTSSGVYNFWGYDRSDIGDYHIAMTSDVILPAGAYMHFEHYWDFESAYDGGVVEYSTSGGSSWIDAGSLFTHNGYTDVLSSSYGNPLGGRQAFAYESRGYTSSRLDLTSLAAQNVRFRFRIGTDSSGDDFGWFIDDVRIYTCVTYSVYLPLVVRAYPATGPTPTPTATATLGPTATTPTPTATSTPTPTPTATPGSTPVSWTTILQENFEGSFPGPWQVSNVAYTWGKRSCRPYAGSYSGWAVGGGSSGGSLGCGSSYPYNADAWMVYGPFSLVGATAADMSFKLWLNSELNYDYFYYLASIDGNTFYGTRASGVSGGWVDPPVLDLSNVPTLGNLMGQPNVWVGFIFLSDASVNYPEGAYVDNIVLRKCTAASCPSLSLLPSVSDDMQFEEASIDRAR